MKLFSSYNAFLALLDDAKKRERLKKLSLEEIPTDAVFGEVRSISRVFQEGLTAEAEIVALLSAVAFRGWRVVLHPDAIRDVGLPWNSFGPLSLIESMDKRNNCGRTAQETFGNSCQAAESGAVLDIGHCLQVDPTMNEAYLILRAFGDHVRQLHVSEVNSRSTHDPLSSAAIDAIPQVVSLLGSSEPFSRGNALMALPETGSRQAVPLLIEALKGPYMDFGRLASLGLIQLTHRSPFEDGRIWGELPSAEYRDWTRWWSMHSSDAAIYKASECGAVEQLEQDWRRWLLGMLR